MKTTQNSLSQHIKHDIKMGVFSQWKKYIISSLIFVILCGQLFTQHKTILLDPARLRLNQIEPVLSFGDYFLFIFHGMKIFNPVDKDFQVNIFWVLVNIYLSYIVSFYPFKDLNGYGQLMLLRSHKRSYWWISKCVWNVLSVTFFYIIVCVITSLFALFTGKMDVEIHKNVQLYFSEINVEGLSRQRILLIAFLLPLIASVAISLFQMLISMILRPLVGFTLTILIICSSIFYCTFWLPGNYIMIMRNESFLPGSGIKFSNGIIVSAIISIFSIFVGLYFFNKKDIFSQPE